tara:strand:- start:442 stop:651 length:210 start_codon:yes stop_codon:yes gene_type:complete
MKNTNNKKSLILINKIQKIRSKNNINWMDMLRLAFKYDPKNSSKIMSKIYLDDQRISKIVKELYKLNIK